MENNIYSGLITALITPFRDGKIDHTSLSNLILLQIKAGVNALVIGGSTGEGSSLDEQDYYELIKSASELSCGRIPIIAGVSAISTESAVNKIKNLNEIKINGIMSVPPLYVKPSQEGIIKHFEAISKATNLPIMLYDNPSRVGVECSDETILKLATNGLIVALKDAGGDIERPLRLSINLPKHFNMLTGDDSKSVAYSAHRGVGCVSVISNILPNQCVLLQNYLRDGNFSKALMMQQKLLPIYNAVFAESNPIGVKCAAGLIKLCSSEIKLPLTPMRAQNQNLLEKALRDIGKING